MRIGVIAEGGADIAVITNILTSFREIDGGDVIALRPTNIYDETDKSRLDSKKFSNWTIVKQECENRVLLDEFLAIDGNGFVIIHIDTAEADQYGISRPNKKLENYCSQLRNLVINKINHWFGEDMSEVVLYAVAIEETDAWVLTIYDNRDSAMSIKPKEKLNHILGKKKVDATSNYPNFLSLSENLSKAKMIKKEKYLDRNESLKAFYEEVETKILPKLNRQ